MYKIKLTFLIFTLFSLLAPTLLFAAEATFTEVQPRLQIPLPNFQFSHAFQPEGEAFIYVPYLAEYISAVYSYMVGVAGLIAIAMIMYGGMKWIFAGGDSGKVTAAKEKIINALIGLVLALGSYLLLYTLNPNLVRFNALSLKSVNQQLIPSQEEVWDTNEAPSAGAGTDFKQGDPQWASHSYPYPATNCRNSNPSADQQRARPCERGMGTVCSSGCGPTSLAIVLSRYGVQATPIQTADFVVRAGGRFCVGTTMGPVLRNFSQSPWPNFSGESVNLDRATQLLQEGKPIIFLCGGCTGQTTSGVSRSYNGHYMVLTGTNGDNYNVSDPGSRTKAMATISRTELQNNTVKGFWYIHP